MHCPRCGQQQVSEEIKFCSRCGLPLGIVSEVVAQGGYLAELDELRNRKQSFFNKKNGVVFGFLWATFCILLAIFLDGIFNINRTGEVFSALGIFGAFMIILASLVYLPSSRQRKGPGTEMPMTRIDNSIYGTREGQAALPPQQSQPASAYTSPANEWRAPDTGQFAFPPSVTDNTTKLLKEDEE
jgi:hypothetical protein